MGQGMTNEEKKKANWAAAELLDDEIFYGMASYNYSKINIFTNPSDCLDVVIGLGNEHNASIESFDDDGNWCCIVHGILHVKDDNFPFNSYQEAVAAAVLEVMKDE